MAQVLFILRLCLSFSASPVSFSGSVLAPPPPPVHMDTRQASNCPDQEGIPQGMNCQAPSCSTPGSTVIISQLPSTPYSPPTPTDTPILAAERESPPTIVMTRSHAKDWTVLPPSPHCPGEGAEGKCPGLHSLQQRFRPWTGVSDSGCRGSLTG